MMDIPSSVPYSNFKVCSPHNTDPLTDYGSGTLRTRGVSCTVAGVISCKNGNGDFTVVPLSAGVIHPIVTTHIRVTDTTATGLVVWW